jgi:hypothetical protein
MLVTGYWMLVTGCLVIQAHGVRRIKVSGVSVQRRRWQLSYSQIEKETLIQSTFKPLRAGINRRPYGLGHLSI